MSGVGVGGLHADRVRPLRRAAVRLQAIDFDWSRDASALSPPFDVVLACECISMDVYGRDALLALVRTLFALCSASTLVVLGVVRRKDDGFEEFVELTSGGAAAKAAGFTSGPFALHRVHAERGCEVYEMRLAGPSEDGSVAAAD